MPGPAIWVPARQARGPALEPVQARGRGSEQALAWGPESRVPAVPTAGASAIATKTVASLAAAALVTAGAVAVDNNGNHHAEHAAPANQIAEVVAPAAHSVVPPMAASTYAQPATVVQPAVEQHTHAAPRPVMHTTIEEAVAPPTARRLRKSLPRRPSPHRDPGHRYGI